MNIQWKKIIKNSMVFVCIFLLCGTALANSRYPKDRIHSPITEKVVNNLISIVSNGSGLSDVFIISGDSISAETSFLNSFKYPYIEDYPNADSTKDLYNYDELKPALDFFLSAIVPNGIGDLSSPFERYSFAAYGGWSAADVLSEAPAPSPLQHEINTLNPRYAIIMFGSNDVESGYGAGTTSGKINNIIQYMTQIIDICVAQGIVPIITAPPLYPEYADETITLQYALRALCQERQIPYINFLKAIVHLPNYGLSTDDLHPSTYHSKKLCHFYPEALQAGYNLRNLLTLQSFNRVYQVFENGATSLDQESPALEGTGTNGDPYIVDEIAFVDSGETTPAINEYYYQIVVSQQFDVRAFVTCQNSVDVDVSLLDIGFNPLVSNDIGVNHHLAPGTYYVKVENKGGIGTNSGKYQLVIMNTDRTYPPTPSNFTAIPLSLSQVNLRWDVSDEVNGVVGYRVYRNNRQIEDTPQASFTDDNLLLATTYTYTVTAYDMADNESFHAPLIEVQAGSVIDTQAPSIPQNLTASPHSSTQVDLSWVASTDTVGVSGYHVYRDGVFLSSTPLTNYPSRGLTASTPYTYTVRAYDASGNESDLSDPVEITTPNSDITQPPSVPENLTIVF